MESNIKVIEKEGKIPGKNIVVMAGVHGDEVCGVKAFDELIRELEVGKGKVTFIYANLEAQKQNKRFIEYNLNRCFLDDQPDKMKNALEGRTAKEIIPFLLKADALLDLHSSNSSDSLKYLICEKNCLDIISPFSPENVIMGIDNFHPGGSDGYMYLQGKPGICIECGLHESDDSVETAKRAVLTFLVETGNISGKNKENITKKLFRSVYLYKNKKGSFKFNREFKDFEEISERTLVGYDGNEKVYLNKNEVIMFPNESK